MGRGRVHRSYNKIVGSFGACGFGPRQVMHRPTDPPTWIECAGCGHGQTTRSELYPSRGNGERDIETIVYKQVGWKDGKTEGKIEVLETRQLSAARMNRELWSPGIGKRPGRNIEVRATRDALVGDCVQPW